jgi:hypothetical protein
MDGMTARLLKALRNMKAKTYALTAMRSKKQTSKKGIEGC